MTSFYELLEELRNGEEEVSPEQLEHPESSLDSNILMFLPSGSEEGSNDSLRDKMADLLTNDEDSEVVLHCTVASSTESQRFVRHAPLQEEIIGTGSLDVYIMDQFPSYGVSKKGELTLIGETLEDSVVNTSNEGAKVKTGSFLQGSDFSLITKKSDQGLSRVCPSVTTIPRLRPNDIVGGSVHCDDTKSDILPKQAVTEPLQTEGASTPSVPESCTSKVDSPKAARNPNQDVGVSPSVPTLVQADVEIHPHQVARKNPASLGGVHQQIQQAQVRIQPKLHQPNAVPLTPSFPLDVATNGIARKGSSQTPATFAPNAPSKPSGRSAPSQKFPEQETVALQQFLKRLDSSNRFCQDEGSCETPKSVQNGSDLQVATSNLQPILLSNTTNRPNINPTSLLDVQVPFQFEDPNTATGNRKSMELTETHHNVNLDPSQILANARLIKHARDIIGKRPMPSRNQSIITPAKRTRLGFTKPETAELQHTPRDVHALFTESQMSPVTLSTQEMLTKRHAALSPRHIIPNTSAVQNFQGQGSFSGVTAPNSASNVLSPGPMPSMNYYDTNVRSENVDLPKRYHCKACLAVFSFRENCDRHFKVVHLKRQVYQCPHCPASYLQPKTMRVHIDKKHCVRTDDVSILPCYWCRSIFKTHQEWVFHATQVHPEQRCKFRGKSS